MAAPKKRQKKKEKENSALSIIDKTSAGDFNRGAIPKGLSIDQVNEILTRGKPTPERIAEITERVRYIREGLDRINENTNAGLYLMLLEIYRHKDETLEPDEAYRFAKFLQNRCGYSVSQSYVKKNTVELIQEFDLERFLVGYITPTDARGDLPYVPNLCQKLEFLARIRDVASKKSLVKVLEETNDLQLKEIEAQPERAPRARWMKVVPIKGWKTRLTTKGIEIRGTDRELLTKQHRVIQTMTRQEIEERYAALQKKK